jgi:hypothetical protein
LVQLSSLAKSTVNRHGLSTQTEAIQTRAFWQDRTGCQLREKWPKRRQCTQARQSVAIKQQAIRIFIRERRP